MPSPFPGMDPYLEDPEFFPGLHERLINEVSTALQNLLPPIYYAELRSRVWVEYVERPFEPDVNVLRSSSPYKQETNGTGTAVAIDVHPVVVFAPQHETRESFVEIYTTRGEQRLITAIEVLSITNKTPGAHGRNLYIRKQREMLGAQVHLVEIDLLRGGVFSTAVPHDRAIQEAGPFDYHVCVHRYDDVERFFVYPIPLRNRLPQIAIPLLPGDASVILDLQSVFDRCYDIGPYRRLNPYVRRALQPPLAPIDAEWATQLLRERGLLPPAG